MKKTILIEYPSASFSLSEDVISLCATLSQAGEDRFWATPDLRGARLNKALSYL